jgi:hypothetical protein
LFGERVGERVWKIGYEGDNNLVWEMGGKLSL